MKIKYTTSKDNLYLYKIPLFNKGKRLDSVFVENIPQEIDEIDWNNVTSIMYIRFVLYRYSQDITAIYI